MCPGLLAAVTSICIGCRQHPCASLRCCKGRHMCRVAGGMLIADSKTPRIERDSGQSPGSSSLVLITNRWNAEQVCNSVELTQAYRSSCFPCS